MRYSRYQNKCLDFTFVWPVLLLAAAHRCAAAARCAPVLLLSNPSVPGEVAVKFYTDHLRVIPNTATRYQLS
jgi:hypothetical protein